MQSLALTEENLRFRKELQEWKNVYEIIKVNFEKAIEQKNQLLEEKNRWIFSVQNSLNQNEKMALELNSHENREN